MAALKTISVSARSKALAGLLEAARKGAVILRDAEGREYILAELDDFDREIRLAREDSDLMRFLDERGRPSETLSLAEVKEALGVS
jgi:hypothetical protein